MRPRFSEDAAVHVSVLIHLRNVLRDVEDIILGLGVELLRSFGRHDQGGHRCTRNSDRCDARVFDGDRLGIESILGKDVANSAENASSWRRIPRIDPLRLILHRVMSEEVGPGEGVVIVLGDRRVEHAHVGKECQFSVLVQLLDDGQVRVDCKFVARLVLRLNDSEPFGIRQSDCGALQIVLLQQVETILILLGAFVRRQHVVGIHAAVQKHVHNSLVGFI
mmetsp:Transcript_18096/g.51477  ORF Transcript_18096/g.51477 Transcript_18096/m.51477 type:complete len:221 (-) Transcript_18096:2977-3639(-)